MTNSLNQHQKPKKGLGVISIMVGIFLIIIGIPLIIFLIGIGLIIFGCGMISIGIKLWNGEDMWFKKKTKRN